MTNFPMGTRKISYGFPLGWHGYSYAETSIPTHWGIPPLSYWFSLESLLLDASFWFAISFFVSLVAIKSARALNLVAIARAGVLGMKTSIMLLVMSHSFIAIGVGLCFFTQTIEIAQPGFGFIIPPMVIRPHLGLGLRLTGSGTITLIATLSMILWKPRNVTALSKERLVK